MFTHNLKIAFRNMWKYKNQTLISIIGLAVGFTCFALATLWIRYEMTFDSFHKNAERIYVVYTQSSSQTGYSRYTANPLAAHLKATFPEIVNATRLIPARNISKITVDDTDFQALTIMVDSSFFKIFDVKLIEGSMNFLIPESNNRAITQEKARLWFGNESPIGKTYNIGDFEFTITAVVSGMSAKSNYPFDIMLPFRTAADRWTATSFENTIIELAPGIDLKAFEKKLYEYDVGSDRNAYARKMFIMPLTKIHYKDENIPREVKFQHILIFALSGMLVVLCSLFNYLTLFVSRFRLRQKELALRLVCGASWRSLFSMLLVEFTLTKLFAIITGGVLTQLTYQQFLKLSKIKMNFSAIYLESLLYIIGIILLSLLLLCLLLLFFRYRSLNMTIHRANNNLSRKFSLIVQTFISVGFAFITIVIIKQLHFLHNSNEMGFSFKNRGSIIVENGEGFADRLRQIPEITEVIDARQLRNMLPQERVRTMEFGSWDGKSFDDENITLEQFYVTPEFCSFYDFKLVAGEMLTAADPDSLVLINEKTAKAFGWYEPIGKHFGNRYTVKGVIKHVYNFAPTIPARPVFYLRPPHDEETMTTIFFTSEGEVMAVSRLVLFKYYEGMWETCKKKIEQLKDEFKMLDFAGSSSIYSAEEEYNKYLKSERNLIMLLSLVSAVCVLICVFGFVSLVSLTCEERRKEIAIRKVNGATASDILGMFAKEYFLLLFIGAAIAFPAGYLIMQRWLEHYAIRTNIPVWIYLSIVLALALVIVLCVGWQVYRSSVENPVEVLKSE